MKIGKRWTIVATLLYASTIFFSTDAQAATKLQNDSIYDVLVDRFFDKDPSNNYVVNGKDPNAFAGGDFAGITQKIPFFTELDFTYLSLGSILQAEDFRGKKVTDYTKLQKNFGTMQDYEEMYEALHKKNIKVMADFPINGVSDRNNLITAKEATIAGAEKGIINWNTTNAQVQHRLIDAALNYVQSYRLDGVRIASIEGVDTDFLNRMIQALKAQNPNLAIISDGPSDADFDLKYDEQMLDNFQQVFKTTGVNSKPLTEDLSEQPTALMIDDLKGTRFTYFSAAENMYPPTRIKLALGAALLLPGTPIMSYGTEIAINGKTAPNTLQGMDFRTNEDIIEFISQIQSLRNGSEALRTGAYNVVENKDGLIVFERANKDEKWFIVINNTAGTSSVDLSEDSVGKNKELYGMFEKDIVRENGQQEYRLVLDREMVEVYQVKDKKGFNLPYLIALGFVYLLFIGFIIAVLKRGKRKN